MVVASRVMMEPMGSVILLMSQFALLTLGSCSWYNGLAGHQAASKTRGDITMTRPPEGNRQPGLPPTKNPQPKRQMGKLGKSISQFKQKGGE
jgi:hypothetical protein